MTDIFSELTDEEFHFLDHFLLNRIDDEKDDVERDEGVLGIAELDGLLTAVVSGPVSVQPSEWLPALWGDCPPAWQSEQEFEKVFSLLVRFMNGIAYCLMETPEEFEPVFLEREVDGRVYTVVDEWCEGFVRGMGLASEAWRQGGEEMTVLLSPILAFTAAGNWTGHKDRIEETEKLQQAITPHVRAIHRFWLERRKVEPVRAEPRVGRNDPCPCGSGKKYKKCCLH